MSDIKIEKEEETEGKIWSEREGEVERLRWSK